MNYLTRFLLLLLLAIVLFSGCVPTSARPTTLRQCQWGTPIPGQSAVRIAQLQAPTASPVVALDFVAPSDHLTTISASAQGKPGQVMVWDIKSAKVVQQLEIEWIHRQLTSLSATGNILVTIEDREKIVDQHRHEFDFPADINELFEVWDVTTGKQQKLLPNYRLGWSGPTIRQIDISHDGRQILEISEDNASLGSTDPTIKHGGQSIPTVVSSEDPNYVPNSFVVGAFDQVGQFFALGFARGTVELQKFTGDLQSQTAGTLYPPFGHGDGKPLALAFDATSARLAILRANDVELYNLQSWLTFLWPPLTFLRPVWIADDLPTTETGKLTFNLQGNVLAIGTPHGWQLRRTSDLTLLTEQTNVAITSLAFSDDGCAVAFGTQEGIVQVWSVPTP